MTDEREGAPSDKKKRPQSVRLDWQGSVANGDNARSDAQAVVIRGGRGKETKPATPAKAEGIGDGDGALPRGSVRLRREKKGRAGHTAIVLYEFSDARIPSSPHLVKALSTRLKERLACGGGAEAGEIVLQTADVARVVELLGGLGIKGIPSGG